MESVMTMMKKKGKTPLAMAVVLMLAGAAGSALAKVTPAEAERLGKDLTCVGAIKAGNKEGTIPEFTGKWVGAPAGTEFVKSSGKHPVDYYANEKPSFVITAENMEKYADKLTPGLKAMFQKYPKTFQMPVYPGHRDFRYPDDVCAVVKKNAVEAEVTEGGMGVKGFMGGIPFPMPKDGNEALWNNLIPARAYTESIIRDMANVLSDGSMTFGRMENNNLDMTSNPSNRGKPVEGVMAYSMSRGLLPEREKGGVTVSSEPLNFKKDKRLAWSYDAGTRRVRQVPEYGFDQPMVGTGGKLTIDSDRLFNGSPERYNWKLNGRHEVYIPANAYKIHQSSVKYKDLLTAQHANPDYMRYELRRVWVLEGTLKEGYRHLYGKRVMYLDEDTGQAILGDMYDARGQLWQFALINYYYSPDINAWHAGTSFYHDLNSGSYMAYNMFQERQTGPVLNKGNLTPAMYTPQAARELGN